MGQSPATCCAAHPQALGQLGEKGAGGAARSRSPPPPAWVSGEGTAPEARSARAGLPQVPLPPRRRGSLSPGHGRSVLSLSLHACTDLTDTRVPGADPQAHLGSPTWEPREPQTQGPLSPLDVESYSKSALAFVVPYLLGQGLSCVSWGNLLNLSEPQISHLPNGNDDSTYQPHWVEGGIR